MADLSKVLDFLVLEPFLPGLAVFFIFLFLLEKFQHFSF
ncbi:putative membrane protein [Streptococcus pneumoniae GA47033]|nr:putative membrane protein [Streptococcus pneumoniae GA47033]